MLKMTKKSVALAATLALGLLVSAPLYADAVIRHFHFALATSTPAADATIEELDVIHLTFTQVPKEAGRLIRLSGPQGGQVELGAVHLSGERVMAAHLEAEDLPDGTYTVNWRGAGDDGHFTTGEYTFTLQSATASQ
jgi:methionine-rich copper-binding protein CopC